MKWTTETRTIDSLIPYEHNPRQMTEKQNKDLTKSLETFDLVEIPAVNQDGVILAGHQRLRIMQALGRGGEVIDVRVPDRLLTEKEVQEYNIRSNKNTGEFDFDVLANAFDTTDLLNWGFDEKDLKIQVDVEDDEVPEPPADPTTKLGDLFQLGNHRLLCGDATKREDVERLMDGKKADMVFTSPPYNAGDNIRGHFYENDTDDRSTDGYTEFLTAFTDLMLTHSRYVFVNLQMLEGNKRSLTDYQTHYRDNIKDILIWNKATAPPHINPGTFATKWEYVIALSNDAKSRAFPCKWQGTRTNVIETENASGNKFADIHKATFPVAFPAWVIESMDFAETVIDPFGGSGTTLIACQQLNRSCYCSEIDGRYVDVIIKRWMKLTGKMAYRIGDANEGLHKEPVSCAELGITP